MRGLAPGEIAFVALAVGEGAEGDVLREGRLVRAGEGETGFDFFGERAEVAVVEGDSVPAADDGSAGQRSEALLSCGAVRHSDGAHQLGLYDFPGVGGGSEQME